MTTALTILLTLNLATYVWVCCKVFGTPETLSDTYYLGAGEWFTGVMSVEAMGLTTAVIADGRGLLPLALMGVAGLLVVAFVPTFRHCDRCHWAHNAGAWLAAIGCVGWSVSVSVWPTLLVAAAYALYTMTVGRYQWLAAELATFGCAFLTLLATPLG